MKKSKSAPVVLTTSEEEQLKFFRRRGAIFLFVSAVASCMEIFCERKIPNVYRISFGVKISPHKGQQIWTEIVEQLVPLSLHLEEAFTYGLQNQERVRSAIQKFKSLVEATASANRPIYRKFARAIVSK